MLSWSSRGTGFEHQPAAVGLVSESKETVFGHMTGLGAEAVGIKQLHDTSCDSRRRVNDRDAVTVKHPPQNGQQKRIMRTPQDNLVGPTQKHVGDSSAHACLGLGRIFTVALDQFDKSPTRRSDDLYTHPVTGCRPTKQIAVKTALGGQDTDYPALCSQTSGFHSGLHADKRHRSEEHTSELQSQR